MTSQSGYSQEMASKKAEEPYAVVLFLPRKETDNSVDLLPSSWIYMDETTEEVFCQYPDPAEYGKLDHWVALQHEPLEKWEYFPIEIITYARDLKKGKRRLKRAFKSHQVRSTDTDNVQDEMPIILNCIEIEKELGMQEAEREEHIDEEASTSNLHVTTFLPSSDIERDPFCDNDSIPEPIKQYVEKKCNAVITAVNSAKRSILYDLEKKIQELKSGLLGNSATITDEINQNKEELGMILPIKTMPDFLAFEEMISSSEDKRKALINFNRTLLFGETCLKKSLRKAMTATISKVIEIEYSAVGRQMRGVGKKDFSKTHTYSCLNDILFEKFGRTEEYKKLPTIISRWLSGAVDREGGRKRRRLSTED